MKNCINCRDNCISILSCHWMYIIVFTCIIIVCRILQLNSHYYFRVMVIHLSLVFRYSVLGLVSLMGQRGAQVAITLLYSKFKFWTKLPKTTRSKQGQHWYLQQWINTFTRNMRMTYSIVAELC